LIFKNSFARIRKTFKKGIKMRSLLLLPIQFYKKNGLVGMCCNSILKLRGGQSSMRFPHDDVQDNLPSSNFIEGILDDEEIAESEKKPFRAVRESPMYPDHEAKQRERLMKSLIAKSNHPLYSKIKSKIPFVVMIPPTVSELRRLAAFRLAGSASAPLTMGAVMGFAMPCAVTFSMLEMYVPDHMKIFCKCAKWTGGGVFYGVCAGVDYLSSGFESQIFGEELPIDAPTLMGTLPTMEDTNDISSLAKSVLKKSSL